MITPDTSEAHHKAQPPTILIVENEVSNRILIERVLSTRGYRCLSASNGQEALTMLDHEHVDLILTDLSMPVLDGFRTTQLIRARPGMHIGCDDYLTKPFKPRQLLEVVDRLLPQPH
jgi:CheY-like chemotaxis protein